MAEKETKIIRVGPAAQADATELLASFGWEVESAYDVTKAETLRSPGYHLVDLHVECDPSRPHYAELRSLAREYVDLLPDYPDEPGRFSNIMLTIASGVIMFLLIATITDGNAHPIVSLLTLLVPGIVIYIVRKIRYEIKFSEVYKARDAAKGKCAEILRKAQALAGNRTMHFKRSTTDSDWDFFSRGIIKEIL
jgi:hypothetical protein